MELTVTVGLLDNCGDYKLLWKFSNTAAIGRHGEAIPALGITARRVPAGPRRLNLPVVSSTGKASSTRLTAGKVDIR